MIRIEPASRGSTSLRYSSRIDAGQLAGAKDRVGDRGAIAAGVGTSEQEVLAGQRGADMEPLDDAVVERQLAILEKAPERDLMVGEVVERPAERRRWGFVRPADADPLSSRTRRASSGVQVSSWSGSCVVRMPRRSPVVKEVLKFPFIAIKSLRDIEGALARVGLHLDMNAGAWPCRSESSADRPSPPSGTGPRGT
jgi:hypothetical protein